MAREAAVGPMRLTDKDLEAALASVIQPDDQAIVVYSGIWSFAHRFGVPAEPAAELILDVLESVAGRGRTLILPTYFRSFPRPRRYDLRLSTPDVGVLSALMLARPGVRRTRQPMYSNAVRGPARDDIVALPATTAWGPDSAMGWMRRHNARICVLGVPWHKSCSFIHAAEELRRVPYRYFKRFAGTLCNGGREIGPCSEVMYVRSLAVATEFDYSPVRARLNETGTLSRCDNPYLPFESATAQDVAAASEALVDEDPYVFVCNHGVVQDWVADGKARELAALGDGEVWLAA